MKNNKKLVLGSVVALALSVGVVAPSLTKADNQKVTKEEARTQAQEALKKAPWNKGYKLVRGLDGNWTYVLEMNPSKEQKPQEQKPEKKQNGYKTKEEADAAAKEALKNDKLNNDYDLAVGLDGNWTYVLKINPNKPMPKPQEQKPEEGNEPETKKPEETKDGYETRAEAAAAAEKALEKDPVNKSYKVKQGSNGRFYYELSPVEEGLEIGYETREEAAAAAKEALENDPINNDYEINQGADGRYYFRTFYNAEKEDPAKPGKEDPAKPGKEDPVKPGKEDPVKPGKKDPVKPGKKDPVKQGTKKPAKAVVKKVNNVNTGVAGLTGVVATLAASAVALFKSKRK